jgi:hypothetical protein
MKNKASNHILVSQLRRARRLTGALASIILFSAAAFATCLFPFPFNHTQFDFDHDCVADIATFNQPDEWWIKFSGGAAPSWCAVSGSQCTAHLGSVGDKIVPADYDGDDKTDVAVYTPSNGLWRVIMSTNPSVIYTHTLAGHVIGDIPQPFDYTGDHIAEIAVFHPVSGNWEIYDRTAPMTTIVPLGVATDITVTGDYDADGRADPAVYTPSSGVWTIRLSVNTTTITKCLDNPCIAPTGAIPVPADYEGDGKTDIALYKPSGSMAMSSIWEYVKSSDTTNTKITDVWGYVADLPIPADYTGDTIADLAIYRPTGGSSEWWIKPLAPQPFDFWGTNVHTPVPYAYTP